MWRCQYSHTFVPSPFFTSKMSEHTEGSKTGAGNFLRGCLDVPMHCVYLQYPEREERAWDGIVTRISRSLGALEVKAEGR